MYQYEKYKKNKKNKKSFQIDILCQDEKYIKAITNIKNTLTELTDKVVDQRTQIKLKELQSIIKPIDKNESVKDEDILNLLQFHELIHEIKSL